jgi:hypothetical protein
VQKGSYEDGYQAALDFARKKLSDKGMFGLGKNTIPNATVKSVNGNQIIVEFDASRLDIFSEGMATKTIIIPDTVKIEKHTPKDPAEVQKAFDEFKKKYDEFLNTAKTGGEMNNPPDKPMPYTVENVALADIKAGDIISVTYEVDASKPDTLNALSVVLNTAPSETVTPPKAEAPVPTSESAPISSAPKSETSVADITSGNTPAPSAQPSGIVTLPQVEVPATPPTAEAPSQTEPTPVK